MPSRRLPSARVKGYGLTEPEEAASRRNLSGTAGMRKQLVSGILGRVFYFAS